MIDPADLTAVTAEADRIVQGWADEDDNVDAYQEVLHVDEDNLARAVLRHIAGHSTDPHARDLAAQVVRALDAPGERWFG